jgi:hypothetical protein
MLRRGFYFRPTQPSGLSGKSISNGYQVRRKALILNRPADVGPPGILQYNCR